VFKKGNDYEFIKKLLIVEDFGMQKWFKEIAMDNNDEEAHEYETDAHNDNPGEFLRELNQISQGGDNNNNENENINENYANQSFNNSLGHRISNMSN